MAARSLDPLRSNLIAAQRVPDAVLAAAIGLTVSQIQNRRHYLRRRQFKRWRPRRCAARAHHRKIVNALDAGRSLSQIARLTGLTLGAVAGYVRRRNLRQRRYRDDPAAVADA